MPPTHTAPRPPHAQATKLSVYEKRVTEIVLETKNLPEALAEHGEVDISGHDIAKLIGERDRGCVRQCSVAGR